MKVAEDNPMLKAIVSGGAIRPLEPLPSDWQEGQTLRVEKEGEIETSIAEIDRDFAVLASLCANNDPAAEEQLDRVLRDGREQSKKQVRRQMGFE
jgi:hypothetical protein